jgi:hypothetical protein
MVMGFSMYVVPEGGSIVLLLFINVYYSSEGGVFFCVSLMIVL